MTPHLPRSFADQIELLLHVAGRKAADDPPLQDFIDWFRPSATRLAPALLHQIPPEKAEIDRFLGCRTPAFFRAAHAGQWLEAVGAGAARPQ